MTIANRLQAEASAVVNPRAPSRERGGTASGEGEDFFSAMRDAGASREGAGKAKGMSAEQAADASKTVADGKATKPGRSEAKELSDVVSSVAEQGDEATAETGDEEKGPDGKRGRAKAGEITAREGGTAGASRVAGRAGTTGEGAGVADGRNAGEAASAGAEAAAGNRATAASQGAEAQVGSAAEPADAASDETILDGVAEKQRAGVGKSPGQTTAPNTGSGQRTTLASAAIAVETEPELVRLRLLQAGVGVENPTVALQLSAEQVAKRLGVLLPGEVDEKTMQDAAPAPTRNGRVIVTVGRGEAVAEPSSDLERTGAKTSPAANSASAAPLSPDAKLAAILGGFGLDNRIFATADADPTSSLEAKSTPDMSPTGGASTTPAQRGAEAMTSAAPAALRAGSSALDNPSDMKPATAANAGAASAGLSPARSDGPAATVAANSDGKTGPAFVVPSRGAGNGAMADAVSSRIADAAKAGEAIDLGRSASAASAAETPAVASSRKAPRHGASVAGAGFGARVDLVSMRTDFEPATRRAERQAAPEVTSAGAAVTERSGGPASPIRGEAVSRSVPVAAPTAESFGKAVASASGAVPTAGQGLASADHQANLSAKAAEASFEGARSRAAETAEAPRAGRTRAVPNEVSSTAKSADPAPAVRDTVSRENLASEPITASSAGRDDDSVKARQTAQGDAASTRIGGQSRRAEAEMPLASRATGRSGQEAPATSSAAVPSAPGDTVDRSSPRAAASSANGTSTRDGDTSGKTGAETAQVASDRVSAVPRQDAAIAPRNASTAQRSEPTNVFSNAVPAKLGEPAPEAILAGATANGGTADVNGDDDLADAMARSGLVGQPSAKMTRPMTNSLGDARGAVKPSASSQIADALASALVDMAPSANAAAGADRTRLRAGGAALKTIQIQLAPEKLGKVNVTLKLIEGNLSVHIEASEPDTAARLKDDSEGLKTLLKSVGFDVDDALVTVGPRDGSGPRMGQASAPQPDASAANQARGDGSAGGHSAGGGQNGEREQGGARSSRPGPASAIGENRGEGGLRRMGGDPSVYL